MLFISLLLYFNGDSSVPGMKGGYRLFFWGLFGEGVLTGLLIELWGVAAVSWDGRGDFPGGERPLRDR